MTLRIISTGGTFEKAYDPTAGQLSFKHSHVPELLNKARTIIPLTELMLIDSLDADDTVREQIADACRATPETQIVIIHGTDTMIRTAQALSLAKIGKTIVLTGAMVPYQVTGSDAMFNLGYAIAAAQLVEPGVWIAMNGQIHHPDQVQKNREKAIFETK